MNTKTLSGQLTLLLLSSVFYTFSFAQAPVKQWDKTFGGTGDDQLHSLQQTSDGGYILGGTSPSNISGDKTEKSRGSNDYWVIKIDSSGKKQWDRTFGGNSTDELHSLQQTSDGGYILGGTSFSRISGDKTEYGYGVPNYWIVKIDADGNKQWDKTYGGSNSDELSSLRQTSDGGYILGGSSASNISGNKTDTRRGKYDYWIVKIDNSGNKQWDKTFGGTAEDILRSLQQTSDGGYILGGWTMSGIGGDKTDSSRGNYDYWIVKIDSNGNKQWDRTLGGSNTEYCSSLQQTSDGGYLVGGDSQSSISGDKTENRKGTADYWIVKLDANGNIQWDKTIGGNWDDGLNALQHTSDGGYILGGYSYSGISGDKTEANKGETDYWIVKIDANGNRQWDKTFGGSNFDGLNALQQTKDSGYILGGTSASGISGDKTEKSRGVNDYWVVKVAFQNTYYHDADQDGYGSATDTIHAFTTPLSYLNDSTDCNDHDNTVYPGALELCDGIDNNCDGVVDEGCGLYKLSIKDTGTYEGDSSQTMLRFKVHLSHTYYDTIKVNYTTINGTAKAPGDYAPASGTLIFAPGTQNKFITVFINGDKRCEGNETLKVKLSNAVNAILSDSIGRGAILNDDVNCIVGGRTAAVNAATANSHTAVIVTPNPANSVVNISLNGFNGNTVIQLLSLQGKLLRTIKAQGITSERLNVADIAVGTYFLTVTDEKGNKQTSKLIVVH